jgi:antitoxin component of RelBE/YafQ-DinJ toxin-antitoxin module
MLINNNFKNDFEDELIQIKLDNFELVRLTLEHVEQKKQLPSTVVIQTRSGRKPSRGLKENFDKKFVKNSS